MSKHTTGPWSLRQDEAGHHREITDRGGTTIISETEYGQETPTNHADWSLISAAPELLDTLKDLRSVVTGDDPIEWFGSAVMRRVDAAIAKAEGRA